MYTISQVSDMVGIAAVTIRSWEQRHGIITPIRKPSGHRMYTEQHIRDLVWLKECIDEQGFTISQAVSLLKRQREQQMYSMDYPEAPTQTTPGYAQKLERLLSLLIDFRTEQAKTLIDIGFTMYGYETMIHQILVPLMVEVGERWHRGDISVGQEHYITQFVMQRCHSFFHIFPIDPAIPKVLAFCPSGEQHQLGLLLFSLFLRQRGVEVLYLGPDTPYEGIEEIVDNQPVGCICLSINNPKLQDGVYDFVELMLRKYPSLQFTFGGQGFTSIPSRFKDWRIEANTSQEWNDWYDNSFNKHVERTKRKGEQL